MCVLEYYTENQNLYFARKVRTFLGIKDILLVFTTLIARVRVKTRFKISSGVSCYGCGEGKGLGHSLCQNYAKIIMQK